MLKYIWNFKKYLLIFLNKYNYYFNVFCLQLKYLILLLNHENIPNSHAQISILINLTYIVLLIVYKNISWKNIILYYPHTFYLFKVFDCRNVTTTSGMFEAICEHMKYSTNKGNIRFVKL